MKHATYIGPASQGQNIVPGDTALIRPGTPGKVLAQFDSFYAQRGGVDLSHGWHEFPEEHFKVDPTTEDS